MRTIFLLVTRGNLSLVEYFLSLNPWLQLSLKLWRLLSTWLVEGSGIPCGREARPWLCYTQYLTSSIKVQPKLQV